MAQTRWLTDEQQDAWRAFVSMSQLLRESLDRQLQRDAGMPLAYYMILAMLSEAPGRALTMTQLARTVRFSASRLSHAASRLETQGWLRRVKQHSDARTTVAELTEEGFAALAAAAPGHAEEVRRILFDPITAEQTRQLLAISRAALDVLAPEAEREASTADTSPGPAEPPPG
jgi:DNA-binding MarR family transcriptional regulator